MRRRCARQHCAVAVGAPSLAPFSAQRCCQPSMRALWMRQRFLQRARCVLPAAPLHHAGASSAAASSPFLKLPTRSTSREQCLDWSRTHEARRGPRTCTHLRAQPGRLHRLAARRQASCAVSESDRGLRHTELGYSSHQLRAPPFGEALSRHLNKKTLVPLRNGPAKRERWPKPRRARRASARERPRRR